MGGKARAATVGAGLFVVPEKDPAKEKLAGVVTFLCDLGGLGPVVGVDAGEELVEIGVDPGNPDKTAVLERWASLLDWPTGIKHNPPGVPDRVRLNVRGFLGVVPVCVYTRFDARSEPRPVETIEKHIEGTPIRDLLALLNGTNGQ